MKLGVLALQGGFAPHLALLTALGHEPREVRAQSDCAGLEGLVMPGGESSAMLRAMGPELRAALEAIVRSGAPTLVTCAGLIVAAAEVSPAQTCLGWLDVSVARNGWGRQSASGVRRTDAGRDRLLIRAPRITRVGRGVEVLETISGEPIRVRAGRLVGAIDHPELRGDPTLHAALFGDATPSVHESR